MKRLSVNLLTNVMLLLAGILLIIFCNVPNLMVWVSRIIGCLFLLPSLAFLFVATVPTGRDMGNANRLGIFPAIGGVCFGMVMLLRPAMFCDVLRLLMGMLLVVLGLFHIIYLLISHRHLKVRLWHFVLPAVVAACGVLSLCLPVLRERETVVVALTGVCLLLFNFTSLHVWLSERKWRREHAQADIALQPDELPESTSSHDDYLPAVEQED